MSRPTIELTIRHGHFGEKEERIAVDLNELAWRDMTRPVELSNNPISLMLASPGLIGGRGNAVTIREETFKLRRREARRIAFILTEKLAEKLFEAFGVDDELDGYKVSGMTPEELAWHKQAGRIK